MNATNKKTVKTVAVACQCCRKARATWIVKDCGFKTWAACQTCKETCDNLPGYHTAPPQKLS